MNIPYYHVDAFTGSLFAGNPAGVCLLESWPEDELLQAIAAENNLPETAFVVPAGNKYILRWFSPKREIDLCGHATLAAAFVLDLARQTLDERISFETVSGTLHVRKIEDMYYLDFPARPPAPCPVLPELVEGLGSQPMAVYRARDYLAVFENEEQIRSIIPDYAKLANLDCLGTIVTAPGREVDFVSRFFAPAAGIPEDPVTGSSHCTLIPYWAEIMGRDKLIARQLSQRGGELFCENREERVCIGGRAKLYLTGTIRIE